MGEDLFLDRLLGDSEGLGDSFVSGGLDDAILDGSVLSAGLGSLDLSDNILKIKFSEKIKAELVYHSTEDFSEDNVSSIEPWGLDRGEEKLRAIGVLASVGHREPTSAVVLELEVLIGKFLAVDRLAACSVSSSEITTLEFSFYSQLSRDFYEFVFPFKIKIVNARMKQLPWIMKSLITLWNLEPA